MKFNEEKRNETTKKTNVKISWKNNNKFNAGEQRFVKIYGSINFFVFYYMAAVVITGKNLEDRHDDNDNNDEALLSRDYPLFFNLIIIIIIIIMFITCFSKFCFLFITNF